MFNIQDRPAKVGANINSRGEHHGEEIVTALDVPLEDIMLDEQELNALLREPLAYRALFNLERGGRVVEPLFPKIKPIALREKLEEATVIINFGLDEWVKLVPAKLAKIKIEPRAGGLTAMSCTIQSTPELAEPIARLLGKLNNEVVISIDGGQWGAQQDLPLNQAGEDEEPEAPRDEAPKRGRGRPRKHESRLSVAV